MVNLRFYGNFFLLLGSILLSSNFSLAQWDTNNQEVVWYGGAGVANFKPIWGDLNMLTASFNDHFKTQISSPFTSFSNKNSMLFETGLILGNSIDIGIRYQTPTSFYNSAKMMNGEIREMKYVAKMTELNMAFNIFHIKKFYFGTNFGGIFGKGTLYSGNKYNNGFISYGPERRLNGIFDMNKPMFTGGFQLYFLPHEKISIIAQYQRVGLLDRKSTITAASGELKDNLDGIGTFYSNHAYTTYLGNNYNATNIADTYFVGLTNTATANIKGNRFVIIARYNLQIADANN